MNIEALIEKTFSSGSIKGKQTFVMIVHNLEKAALKELVGDVDDKIVRVILEKMVKEGRIIEIEENKKIRLFALNDGG